MKILLTGVYPFDREKVNPAFEAVKLLPDTIAGAQIVKLEVPTQFVRAGEVLEAAMAEYKPDVVICVGQAGGRAAITPEKVAINLMDGRIPDNVGYQPTLPRCRSKPWCSGCRTRASPLPCPTLPAPMCAIH